MGRYRKKPVVIEAFQMTKERRWDNSEWPVWLNMAWNTDQGEVGSVYCVGGGEGLFITTLNGPVAIEPGEWICSGVKGELYPCKPDIFEATYEEERDHER